MRSDRLQFNPWIVFWVTALGVSLASIDGGIVNVALPTLVMQFHISVSESQWIITSYLIMICVTLPLAGYLSDLYTRRKIYLLGFWIFTLSSVLCGLSFSFLSLVAFRFLQGIGASMILGNNQAILMTTFPKEIRGRALGINSMIVAVGSIIGPSIGGFLVGLGDWRYIFFINLPIGLIGSILGIYILPKIQAVKKPESFDYYGPIFFSIMLVSLILMLTYGSPDSWMQNQIKILTFIFLSSSVLFFLVEKKARTPMFDFGLLKNWPFFSGILVAFIMFIALSTNMLLLPFYLQMQKHLSPQHIGLILLITPAIIFFVAPISGYFIDRINPLIFTAIGLLLMLIGMFSQAWLTQHSSLLTVIIDQLFIGVGSGLFTPPNNYTIFLKVPDEKMGLSNSLAALMRNMGKIMGTAMASIIFSTVRIHVQGDAGFSLGFRYALLTACLFIVIAIILTLKRQRKLTFK